MSQRYFLTAESTYEDLRLALNTELQYPNTLGKSVFQTALYAPRDNFRRVLLAVDTDLPGYTTVSDAIAPLLASDAMEEIDEATYLAAVSTAGAALTFSQVADSATYVNFSTTAGSLSDALSGIDGALTGKANASHTHNSLVSGTAASGVICDDNVVIISGDQLQVPGVLFSDSTFQTTAWTGAIGSTSGLVLKTGTSGAVEALAQGTAGQVLWVNSGATAAEWHSLTPSDIGAAALSHAHSAADITSGTLADARLSVNAQAAINLYLWSSFR